MSDFDTELISILCKYKGLGNYDALDGDEVDVLADILKKELNLIEGNITSGEYNKLNENK